jgi:hypothetical protein
MDDTIFNPLNLCFKVIKVLGYWQDGNQSWTYFFFGHFLHFQLVYVQMYFVFNYLFHANDPAEFIDTLGMLTAFIGTDLKILAWLFNIKEIVILVEAIKEALKFSYDERFKSRKHIEKQSKLIMRIYKFFWGSAIVSCTLSIFVPLKSHKQSYNVRFPFDTDFETNAIGFWLSSFYSSFDMYIVVSKSKTKSN